MKHIIVSFFTLLRLFPLIVIILFISGCVNHPIIRGNAEIQKIGNKIDDIKVGIYKDEIISIFGNPSTKTSINGKEEWIYFYSKRDKKGFLAEKPVEQIVVKILFKDDSVESFQKYSKNDAKNIEFSDAKTPIEGDDMSIQKELFSNIGRFNIRKNPGS